MAAKREPNEADKRAAKVVAGLRAQHRGIIPPTKIQAAIAQEIKRAAAKAGPKSSPAPAPATAVAAASRPPKAAKPPPATETAKPAPKPKAATAASAAAAITTGGRTRPSRSVS